MMKNLMLVALSMMAITATAAPKAAPKPYWLDPSVNRVGTEAPRSSFFA